MDTSAQVPELEAIGIAKGYGYLDSLRGHRRKRRRLRNVRLAQAYRARRDTRRDWPRRGPHSRGCGGGSGGAAVGRRCAAAPSPPCLERVSAIQVVAGSSACQMHSLPAAMPL